MPFGLINAPAAFMNFMNGVFHENLDDFVIVFVDDVFICSDNEESYEEHLILALKVLRNNNLYAKFSIYNFWINEVLLLGHIISKDSISVDPSKVVAVKEWSQPKNVNEVRSFLGLSGITRDSSKISPQYQFL